MRVSFLKGKKMKIGIKLLCFLAVCTIYLSYANPWTDYGRAWADYGQSWAESFREPSKPKKPKKPRRHKKDIKKSKKQKRDEAHKDKDVEVASWAGWGSSWAGFGTATAKDSENQDLFMNGVISLRDRVLHKLTVNGVVDLQNVSLDSLNVNGPASLAEVTVTGKTDINGPLDARASKLNTIDISTSRMDLDNCIVKSINVRSSDTKRKEQIIVLTDTIIEDSIVFEEGNGKVILKGTKSVVKGKIIGGIESRS